MPPELEKKYETLKRLIQESRSILVAYSGGVDSALVLAVATRELGERALGCIGVSPSFPDRERLAAIAFAEQIGARYRIIHTSEMEDPNYTANPDDRCYYCKSNLFDHLRKIAVAEGWAVVADGTNQSDLGDDRPGCIAAGERGVRSPLLEAGLSKADVRAIARELSLNVWDKPASPCLSSRVEHGTMITPDLLSKIEKAEDHLVKLGFREFRVRHHGSVARVQVAPLEIEKAVQYRVQIVEGIRACGYRHVTLDLSDFVRNENATSPTGSEPCKDASSSR